MKIDSKLILRRLKRMDWLMLAAILCLLVIGVLFIYSACYRSDEAHMRGLYKKQIVWIVIGILAYLVFAIMDYHKLRELVWPIYAISLFLLVSVLLFGTEINGSRRWFRVFGILVQPSEFAKLATVLALSRFLGHPGRDVKRFVTTALSGLLVLVPFVLIFKEPDLGTAMVLVPIALLALFVSGVPAKTLIALSMAGMMLLPAGWFVLREHQKERILVFFDPGRDPLGAGWNKMQSQIAVATGGKTGKGFRKGTQNVLGYLPSDVAPTDFIFSVIAEETGFVGTSLILAFYAAVLSAGVRAAYRAREKFGRLLAVGVTTMIFAHVWVNVAMTIGKMPITGLPLPLISYGGSFTLSTMAALGMVQSVYIRRVRR